jgi:2-polyprenyl-3-methyl-5-hydroxy-6-metoxy-1,4-benzoquinol methylase
MKTEHVNCDLCGADDYTVLWDKTEREKAGILRSVVIRDESGNIIHGRNVMCKRCGLVYVTPRMSREELDQFYREDYRKIYKGKNTLEAEKWHAETAFKILELALPLEPRKVLDIGCSTGLLPDLLFWRGFAQPYGIEPNKEHCDIARENPRIGNKIENCTIENYNPDFGFDIITMLNALEHVLSPTAVLNKIHSLLNDGGYVLISVPNLENHTIHISVDAFLSNAHLFNFTPATLAILMRKCGLVPVKAYPVIEEMGEKVYILAQKGEPNKIIYDDDVEQKIVYMRDHFVRWEQVYKDKLKAAQWGYR